MFDESILKEILVSHSFGVCSSDIVILESGYCDPDHIWIRYRSIMRISVMICIM